MISDSKFGFLVKNYMFCQLEMSRIQYFFKELQDEGQNIENQGKGMIVFSATPQQYNKKPVKIDQGLDFLKVWRGKSKKTRGKTTENKGKTIKSRKFRALFSY